MIPLNVCAIVMVLWEWKLSKIAKCLKSLNDFKLKFNDVFTLTETEPDAETVQDKMAAESYGTAVSAQCEHLHKSLYNPFCIDLGPLLVWVLLKNLEFAIIDTIAGVNRS